MEASKLGQIFTRRIVADYMVDLFTVKRNSKILDPCFGEGVFINACVNKGYKNLVGMEIDSELYNSFKKKNNVNIINSDFLNYKFKNKFDGIIMNPPYIRQENINKLNKFGITKQKLKKNIIFKNIPNKANLYFYFIAKSFNDLKENGQLIVVFPSSWINSNSENALLKIIDEYGYIDTYINVSGKAFEKSVLTNVCILKCIKCKKYKKLYDSYKLVIKGETLNLLKKKIESKKNKIRFIKNVCLDEYAVYKRGITTGYNEFFINPKNKINNKFIKRIISSPKQIKGYSTNDAQSDSLLVVCSNNIDHNLQKYINEYSNEIIKSKKPSTIYNKIVLKKDWYKIKTFDCCGIIFSYIIRNNMKFIVNNEFLVRDNFYIIYPKIDILLLFALLNNYYVYYQLESVGKKYGNGLLKLQTYDLNKILLPNIEIIDLKDRKKLQTLSNELIMSGDKSFVNKITKVLSKYSSIYYDKIILMYNNSIKARGKE